MASGAPSTLAAAEEECLSPSSSPRPPPTRQTSPTQRPIPPPPSSPTESVASGARSVRSNANANGGSSNRNKPHIRRASKTAPSVAGGGMSRSTSSSSIAAQQQQQQNGASSRGVPPPPPSLDGPDDAADSVGTNAVAVVASPLPTPRVNSKSFFSEQAAAAAALQQDAPQPTVSVADDDDDDAARVCPDPHDPDHRRRDLLPRPLHPPSRCPLLCVFYAEFDIVVGPRVCFQSPQKFMHFDVDVSREDIDAALEETFQSVLPDESEASRPQTPGDGNTKENVGRDDVGGHKQPDSEEYWNWSPSSRKSHQNHSMEREMSDISSQITMPASGNREESSTVHAKESASSSKGTNNDNRRDDPTQNAPANAAAARSSHSRTPSYASSRGTNSHNQPTSHEGDASTIDTTEPMANSIFAATSEYIITGNELADQTITVSTHGMHVMSRPMIINDSRRYERNSLLFAVGFVLRRSSDPRPYWPCLSNLASALRAMEVESEFLSRPRTRPLVQTILEDVLVSLNSKRGDCHLILDEANLLNLQLFRPPAPPTPPVPDYAVPILLRPEWQLQMYDWDLAINWIVPHIDGCKYLKQIAVIAEVDLEMVRACLRVLRHHGVLAYVDVFRYSNVYECTPFAMKLLSGKRDKKARQLIDAAFWYGAKSKYRQAQQAQDRTRSPRSCSPSSYTARRMHSHMSSLHSLDLSVNSSNTPWAAAFTIGTPGRHDSAEELSRSFPSRAEHVTIKEETSMDDDESPQTTSKEANQGANHRMESMKNALAEIYLSCRRQKSFRDMLLAKLEDQLHKDEKTVAKSFVDSALSPLCENAVNSDMDNERKQHGINGGSCEPTDGVDWKLAFDFFDHRRLIVFGLVRGLIRRVHQYPLAYKISVDENEHRQFDSDDGDSCDDNSRNEYSEHQVPISSIKEAITAVERTLEETPRSSIYSTSPSPLPSPLLQGFVHHQPVSRATKKENKLRSRILLMERVASAMNGSRCDDELSCMFEMPIEKLIVMLKDTGRWDVISVYSCAN